MITREHVTEIVTNNIVDTLEDIEPAAINPDQSMKDLGANSLDIVEIVSCCMRELKVKVPRNDLSELSNIKQLIDLLCDAANKPQQSPPS